MVQSSKSRSLNPLQNLNITVRALKLATREPIIEKKRKKEGKEKKKRMDTDFIGYALYPKEEFVVEVNYGIDGIYY